MKKDLSIQSLRPSSYVLWKHKLRQVITTEFPTFRIQTIQSDLILGRHELGLCAQSNSGRKIGNLTNYIR